MNCRSCREKIVPSWSLWHHPRRNPTKTFFQDKFSFPLLLVFIPTVLFPFQMLSNLLCNFIMDLQFYYGFAILLWFGNFIMDFAILLWVCTSHVLVNSSYIEVCNSIMDLQLYNGFTVFIMGLLCNFDATCSNAFCKRPLVLYFLIWPRTLDLHAGHDSTWKTKNELVLSKIDFCLLLKSSK